MNEKREMGIGNKYVGIVLSVLVWNLAIRPVYKTTRKLKDLSVPHKQLE